MDKLKTISVGGFPLVLDDLRQFFGRLGAPSEGIYQAFNNILRGLGDNVILQGVVVSGTTPNVAITEGWVLLDGELIKVDAQTGIDTTTDNKFVKETTFDSRGTKTFLNGSINETYEKNRAVVQGTSGNLDFDELNFGQWDNDITPNPSDFTSSTGTWVPSLSIVNSFIVGKKMTVQFTHIFGTLAGGPTSFVKFKIPRGKTSSATGLATSLITVVNPSPNILSTASIDTGDDTIKIQTFDGTNYIDGAFGTFGTITFEID